MSSMPDAFSGFVYKRSPSVLRAMMPWQRRYLAVCDGTLSWWSSSNMFDQAAGHPGSALGHVDLSANDIVVNRIEGTKSFSLSLKAGYWKSAKMTNACSNRVLEFDVTDSQETVAAWCSAIQAHASWRRALDDGPPQFPAATSQESESHEPKQEPSVAYNNGPSDEPRSHLCLSDDVAECARKEAERLQQARFEATELASDEVKSHVSSSWDGNGGPAMEKLITSTTLIDAHYYVDLVTAGGVLPRWQEIPNSAKLDSNSLWRLRCWDMPLTLPVLCWSYCWLSPDHPDPHGEQIRKALPLLNAMLKKAAEFGKHATIGILQDFASYPQHPRTKAETERFIQGLKTELDQWYAHPFTHVLIMNVPMSEGPAHTNHKHYDKRGWCFVEKHLSSIVKDQRCLWDFSMYRGANDYCEIREEMKAHRLPMKSPDRVAEEMRTGVHSGQLSFTSSSDVEFVISLYERGFKRCFDSYVSTSGRCFIEHKILGWGDVQALQIAEAIGYVAKHCEPEESLMLDFRGNIWSDHGKQAIQAAVASAEGKLRVRA